MNERLPRILRFTGTTDGGEFGNASCPHCGAPGRYVHHFVTETGKGAAMSGCMKLFPVAPIALEEQRLRKKQAEHGKKGWKLNQADARALETIEQFYLGHVPEAVALAAVRSAKASNAARFKRHAVAR